MASENRADVFVTSWRFVDSADKESSKQARLHAMREANRRQKWRKETLRKNSPRTESRGQDAPSDATEAEMVEEDGAGSDEDVESLCSDKTKSTSSSESERRRRLHRTARAKRKSPLAVTTAVPSRSLESFDIESRLDPRPLSLLGAGRANPFDTYPAPNTDQRLDILTDTCTVILNLYPFPPY